MFRSKPPRQTNSSPRHSHPPPLTPPTSDPIPPSTPPSISTTPTPLRVRKRLPWRRVKSGTETVLLSEQPSESVSDESGGHNLRQEQRSILRPGPFKRLSSIFKETDGRAEENLKSLKRRVVQVRRQPDDAPVRFQLGFRSRTGWEPIRAAKENQDCLVALVPWGPDSRYNLFAALDGHGRYGHQCAIFVAQKVVSYLERKLTVDATREQICITMHKAITYAERKLESPTIPVDYQLSGSTGVFVLVRGCTLFCANVGDSRAVVGREKDRGGGLRRLRNAGDRVLSEGGVRGRKKDISSAPPSYFPVPLSVDQKPSRPDEKTRLLQAGARVDAWEGVDVGEERVWLPEARTPGLAVSRSFGDLMVKAYGVVSTPEVYVLDLCEDDRFMVMASDGVFEMMRSEEVVDVIGKWREKGSAQEAAEEIVKLATERWIDDETVIDDISCVVVFMNVVSPDVLGPKEPVFVDTNVGAADNASEVGKSPSSRNLSQHSLPEGLELVTPSSSSTPLHKVTAEDFEEMPDVDIFGERDKREEGKDEKLTGHAHTRFEG